MHYERFLEEQKIELSLYEKMALRAYRLLKLDIESKDYDRELEFAEIYIRFKHALCLSLLVTLLSLPFAISIILIGRNTVTNMFAIMLPIIVFGAVLYYPLYRAKILKMKMLGQGPLAILYLVIALEVTPNLESAVTFAAKNLPDPLGRAFKRLLWEVETRKKPEMSEALYDYSTLVKEHLPYFSEALYLVASSPREIGENRKRTLEKAVTVILEGTKSTMERFARSLGLPVMALNSFGILLPVIMLVLGPVASIFIAGGNLGIVFAIIYDFFIPLILALIGLYVLARRPGSTVDISYRKPDYTIKLGNYRINGKNLMLLIFAIFMGIQLLLIQATGGLILKPTAELETMFPSFFTFPLVIAISLPLGIYLMSWSYGNREIRERVKELERQFSSALYQLGNVLSTGIPLEQAFEEVADKFRGTEIEVFFRETAMKVKRLGWTAEKALFDPHYGTLTAFPSNLIKNVMAVLLRSAEKGPVSASLTASGISNYLRKMWEVNEKIEDLLAEEVAGMRFQGMILIPLITGTVVGLGEIISRIILEISRQMISLGGLETAYVYGTFTQVINVRGVIQPSFLQIIVGIYTLIVCLISGWLTGGLEEGWDKVTIFSEMGRISLIGMLVYVIMGTLVGLIFGGAAMVVT